MRKIRLLTMAITMAIATTPVFASSSPVASNVQVMPIEREMQQQEVEVKLKPWFIPKDSTSIEVNDIDVFCDYDGLDKKVYTSTATKGFNDNITKSLQKYVDKHAVGKKKFEPIKIRMYRKGKSIWDGFGKVTYHYFIGDLYNGQTATIYLIHKDGRITEEKLTVSNGVVTVKMDEMGTFIITI